ncbi:MAG: hypothetical protein ACD_10C00831G0003 [uncultured bacterium]|nr:MAG: hypothetical protein ACD_10C00831G0003 [uncultured bacterium]
MVLVESAPIFVHLRVLFPGLGDHQHDCLRHRIAAHDKQLEGVIEGGRIGLSRVMQGPDFLQVVAKNWRGNGLFARLEPVDIAAHRIDFTVVGNVAEWMRQIPSREGIGRKALVHHGQRRNGALVLEIKVIDTDLIGQQQTFVIDRPCREGRNVKFLPMLEVERLDGVCGTATNDVKLAFQGIGDEDIRTTADEDLTNHRFGRLDGWRHWHRGADWHITPAEQYLPFSLDRAFNFFNTSVTRSRLLRQENHADAVFARRRQNDTLLGHFFAVELVGNLDKNACTVALQRVGANGTAVIQIFQDQQALLDDTMRFLTFKMGHKAHATSVVLVCGVIQTLPLWYSRFHHTHSFK